MKTTAAQNPTVKANIEKGKAYIQISYYSINGEEYNFTLHDIP